MNPVKLCYISALISKYLEVDLSFTTSSRYLSKTILLLYVHAVAGYVNNSVMFFFLLNIIFDGLKAQAFSFCIILNLLLNLSFTGKISLILTKL